MTSYNVINCLNCLSNSTRDWGKYIGEHPMDITLYFRLMKTSYSKVMF